MKICEECGMEVEDNLGVCPNCGCPFPVDQSGTHIDIGTDEIICPECSQKTDAHKAICQNCGYPLEIEQNNIMGQGKIVTQKDQPVNMGNNEPIQVERQIEQKHMGALVHCPECGQDTYSEDEFCEHCGFPVRAHYEKLNKRKITDIIDDFSFKDVKDYFNYIIYEARNTIKIVSGALILILFFAVVTLCGSIANAGKRSDAKEKYEVAYTQAVNYDNASMRSIAESSKTLITKYTVKMIVNIVIFVGLSVLTVISIRILIKDYKE